MLLLERYRLSPTNDLAGYLPSSFIIDFLLKTSLSGVMHTYFVLKCQPFILVVLKKKKNFVEQKLIDIHNKTYGNKV